MKITNETINTIEINKSFTIELDNGKEINIYKWQVDDPEIDKYDGGWDFQNPKDKELYDSLEDDEQIEVDDLIIDINLFNN